MDLEIFGSWWTWFLDRFLASSFYENVVAGIIVALLQVAFVALIARHVTAWLARRLNEIEWQAARQRLSETLVRSADKVSSAADSLLQDEGNRVYPMRNADSQARKIILWLEILDAQATLHIPAFNAGITSDVSLIADESARVRETAVHFTEAYLKIKREFADFESRDTARHVPHYVLIPDENGDVGNTEHATSNEENDRRYFVSVLITLSQRSQRWVDHVLAHTDHTKHCPSRVLEEIHKKNNRAKFLSDLVMKQGLWLSEYRKTAEELKQ